LGYFVAIFTSTMAFFKNSQATTNVMLRGTDPDPHNYMTSSITRSKRKLTTTLERWVTWVHATLEFTLQINWFLNC